MLIVPADVMVRRASLHSDGGQLHESGCYQQSAARDDVDIDHAMFTFSYHGNRGHPGIVTLRTPPRSASNLARYNILESTAANGRLMRNGSVSTVCNINLLLSRPRPGTCTGALFQ